jgi:hypothetical protein
MLSFFEKMLEKKRWLKRLGGRCGFTLRRGASGWRSFSLFGVGQY